MTFLRTIPKPRAWNDSPLERFKAQRLFKLFATENGYLTGSVFNEMCRLGAASMDPEFPKLLPLPWKPEEWLVLHHILYYCKEGWFPVEEMWQLKGSLAIDWAYLLMEQWQHIFASDSNATLESRLARECDLGKILAIRLRLATLALQDSKIEQRSSDEISSLVRARHTTAKEHLLFVLEHNPASWMAHKLLSVAHWHLGDEAGACLSAQRALLLRPKDGDLWTMLGCIEMYRKPIHEGTYPFRFWLGGCAHGSYESAMLYGMETGRIGSIDYALQALKLAVHLAKSDEQREAALRIANELRPGVDLEQQEDLVQGDGPDVASEFRLVKRRGELLW